MQQYFWGNIKLVFHNENLGLNINEFKFSFRNKNIRFNII